jgi:hypothetical protein
MTFAGLDVARVSHSAWQGVLGASTPELFDIPLLRDEVLREQVPRLLSAHSLREQYNGSHDPTAQQVPKCTHCTLTPSSYWPGWH